LCAFFLFVYAHRFEFFAGDDVFLGAAAKAYASEGQDWRRSYYLPTSADLAITKLRQWLDKYSGGRLPFPQHMQVGLCGQHQLLPAVVVCVCEEGSTACTAVCRGAL
jgi:hypothetical protein